MLGSFFTQKQLACGAVEIKVESNVIGFKVMGDFTF